MAIALKDIIEGRERASLDQPDQVRCAHCGVVLQETITGKRKTADGFACSDCYYEPLGKLVEEHPIASARVRRG